MCFDTCAPLTCVWAFGFVGCIVFFHTTHVYFAHSKLLCTEYFYTKTFLTHKLLHTESFYAYRHFLHKEFLYTQKCLHTTNSYTKRFYTQQTFAHRKLLRRETFTQRDFTHRNFDILHRDALIQMCVCSIMYVVRSRCFCVRTVVYALLCMYHSACIVKYVYYVCIVLYVLLCMYCEVCIVEYVLFCMYCPVCIVK